MRKVGAARAALANLFFAGLGYVYLGRLSLAVLVLLFSVSAAAVAGWSGFVFEPAVVYALLVLLLGLGLFTVVHAVVVARRHRELRAKPYNRWWFYALWIVAWWFLPDVLMKYRSSLFGFEPFRAASASMAPTIERGDFVMTDSRYFGRHKPTPGQLAVFRLPRNEDVLYIKRIVGLPGDVIEIRKDVLYRNGEAVDEPYIELARPGHSEDFGPITTPDGSYFLLGDNRHNSLDSRMFGAIPERLLHARVEHRWFAFEPGDGIRWERFPEQLSDRTE